MTTSEDPILIRRADAEDAERILQTHLASINGLCARDYTQAERAAWTGPKRAEWYVRAIEGGQALFVAEERQADRRVVGFGQLDGDEILSLYVHADHAGRGVGRALLRALEDEARQRGITTLRLNSTLTARNFYVAHGYRILGQTTHPVGGNIKLRCVAMAKALA